MPDQYSGNNPIICRIHARLSLAHAVHRPVSISSGRNPMPCDTVANWHQTPHSPTT